jgi:plasmid stabilization system protein ParE
MNSYLLTPRATTDIFKIWSYIARDSESAADRVEQAIYAACSSIAQAPMHGHLRQNLTSRPLRFWTLRRYPNYSVAYRPDTTPVEIVAVIHGRRNIPRLLRRR